jgi:hypothetical protein
MPQRTAPKRETFGDLNPWAEPAWYNVLSSPYYNESHRKLRRYVRDYMNENVLDFAEEWEEKGEVPREVSLHVSDVLSVCFELCSTLLRFIWII